MTINSAGSHYQSISQPDRERSEVRRSVRLAVVAGLFLVIAPLFAAFSIRVGTHLMAAWWFESLRCTVGWELHGTSWRDGGSTSVSYRSRNSWDAVLNDDDLDHLRKLLHVVRLDLGECERVTDKGLARLRALDSLTELNLARLDRYRYARFGVTSVPLTDTCLINLQALRRLEKLTLAGNIITDTGLCRIATMANLKTLDLEATEVSDAGLVYLEGMKNLEMVYLGATRVTKKGLTKLQMARPDLTIELDVEPAIEEGIKLRRGASS